MASRWGSSQKEGVEGFEKRCPTPGKRPGVNNLNSRASSIVDGQYKSAYCERMLRRSDLLRDDCRLPSTVHPLRAYDNCPDPRPEASEPVSTPTVAIVHPRLHPGRGPSRSRRQPIYRANLHRTPGTTEHRLGMREAAEQSSLQCLGRGGIISRFRISAFRN